MHNLLRFIRQNRRKLIKWVLILAFLILILQLLNYFAGENVTINYSNNDNSIYNTSNGTIVSDKSAVSGTTMSINEIQKVGNRIEEFVKLCNDKNIDEAYNLLSTECKEEVFQNQEEFVTNYYEPIFSGENRTYTIENWAERTYIVKFTEDMLATGKSTSNASYSDYITIVDDNGEKKLNINKFMGKEEIHKQAEKDNIKIEVISKIKYMDYEIYEVKATNNRDTTILLDQLTDTKNIYLKDSKDNRHYAYSNEIVKEDLKIFSGFSKTIKIKFDNPYITGRKITELCFPNIVQNYVEKNYGATIKTKISINI